MRELSRWLDKLRITIAAITRRTPTDAAARAKVFISYRRKSASAQANRIHDRLSESFDVFLDRLSLPAGQHWRPDLIQEMSSCDLLLVLIGEEWLRATAADGTRRLNSPEDYVRQEIETAIFRGIPVIPIMIGKAALPAPRQLPGHLVDLADRQAIRLADMGDALERLPGVCCQALEAHRRRPWSPVRRPLRLDPERGERWRWLRTTHDPEDRRALDGARRLYESRLPAAERDDWDEIERWIEDSTAVRHTDRQVDEEFVTVLLQHEDVVAMAHLQYNFGQPYAWSAYLVSARGKGIDLGAKLISSLIEYIVPRYPECEGIIFEVDMPSAPGIDAAEVRRRQARIRLYRMCGGLLVDVPYNQPQLRLDSEHDEVPMHLMHIPFTNQPPRELPTSKARQMFELVALVQGNAFAGDEGRKFREYLDRWLQLRTRALLGEKRSVRLLVPRARPAAVR